LDKECSESLKSSLIKMIWNKLWGKRRIHTNSASLFVKIPFDKKRNESLEDYLVPKGNQQTYLDILSSMLHIDERLV